MKLSVPLMVYVDNDYLCIVRNKQKEKIKFPTPHKVYIKNPKGYNKGIDLFTKELINLNVKHFNNIKDTRKYVLEHENEIKFVLPYTEQLFIQEPDLILKYPQDKDLDILTFDIETYNRANGKFPNSQTEPITIISYKLNNQETQVINLYDKENSSDKAILQEFIKVFKEFDPDVVVGYNCYHKTQEGVEGFDLPYIIDRCIINELPTDWLSRFGQNCYYKTDEGIKYNIKDRCIYDVYMMADKDQGLSGIYNLKLETVAEWFKIPTFKWNDIYEKESSYVLDDPRLIDHVKSDVDATYALFKIYFEVSTGMADFMKLPLDSVANSYSSFIPKMFMGRGMYKEHLVPFNNNEERYKNCNIQAAKIGMLKRGYHPFIHAVDAASFYPSCMRTFNLGPDTVKFIGFKEYTGKNPENFICETPYSDKEALYIEKPIFKNLGDRLYVEIPDANFQKNICVEIDKTKVSYLKENMEEFRKKRATYKYEAEKDDISEEKRTKLLSESSAIKVIMNSTYGFLSNSYAKYGDLASGICIVGFARWILTSLINQYKDHVIYFHTDSMFVDCELNLDEVNKFVKDLVESNTGLENLVIFEEKGKFSGYFHKMGNYLLKKIGKDKIEYHGVTMKSSKSPKYARKAINELGKMILDGVSREDQIKYVMNTYTLNDVPLEDFIQTIKITKMIEGDDDKVYKNLNAITPALMARAKKLYDKTLKPGDSIDYYKSKYSYKVSKQNIDLDTFRKIIYDKSVSERIIYSILLNEYIKLEDKELLNAINKLFLDKKLITCINIDSNLIENEEYKKLYEKKSVSWKNIETTANLNRMLFDIIFKDIIKKKFTIGGYVLAEEIKSKEDLDMEYYRDFLKKGFEIYDLDPITLSKTDNIPLESWHVYIKPKR